MHDLLRMLEPEKKRKWSQYLPELTYMYNATPHSSTGYSPYFLFFGHHPRLPVDNLLNTDVTSHGKNLDEWVASHLQHMKEARALANRRMAQKASQRKARHDKKAKDVDLSPGSFVLLRNRVLGRNKIQDKWNPTPYVVVRRISKENHVYEVCPADGRGKMKNIHRIDLLECPDIRKDSESEGSDTVEDSEEEGDMRIHIPDIAHDDVSELSEQESSDSNSESDGEEEPPVLRRSTRNTAGKHSNPHRLPKSVLQETLKGMRRDGHEVSYTEFSDAISSLGQSLGQSLSQTLGSFLQESFTGRGKPH